MKIANYLSLAALAFMTAACSSDDNGLDQQPVDVNGEITITATLEAADGAKTRALSDPDGENKIQSTWAATDQFAILYNNGTEDTKSIATVKSINASTVTITFTIPATLADNTACKIVYPASAANAANTDADVATALATQDGNIENCPEVRVGTATIDKDNHSLTSVTKLAAQNAVFKFTLEGPSIDATHPLVIKDNASNTTITTVTPASTATSVFVAMPEAASKAYNFVVTTADNKYIKSGTAAIAAGKYYQTTLTMEPRYPLALSSATAKDDLGAVVCSDGTLSVEKAAAPSGKTAVGILGMVTETGHGLILALKDATSQNWNTINGWTSVTTYASTTLKVLPDDAARGANLTSYTTLGATAVSNWAVAQKSDYEAIFTNLGSTTGNENGKTYDGNVNAYITTGVGGTALSGLYWSATESSSADGARSFASDYWCVLIKSGGVSVRPVLGF